MNRTDSPGLLFGFQKAGALHSENGLVHGIAERVGEGHQGHVAPPRPDAVPSFDLHTPTSFHQLSHLCDAAVWGIVDAVVPLYQSVVR